MKRWIAWMLMAAMCTGFAACGVKPTSSEEKPNESVVENKENADIPVEKPREEETDAVVGPESERVYLDRVLSDERLSELMGKDLKTLQAEISTAGDAVAFLKQFSPQYRDSEGRMDLEYLYELHVKNEATSVHTYTVFAAWCLVDDYADIKYLVCTGEKDMFYMFSALIMPVQGGYYVYSPYNNTNTVHWNIPIIKEAKISTLKNLEEKIEADWDEFGPRHIFLADGDQFNLQFVLDRAANLAAAISGEVELVYTLSEKKKAEIQEQKKNYYIKLFKTSWDSYRFPASFNPTLSSTQIEELLGKDLDTVASALKTVGDVILYFAVSGYETADGELTFRDGEIYWSFNQSPQIVFSNNKGTSGGTAGLVAYFLQSDYDEMGLLTMACKEEDGSGHVINYFKTEKAFYVLDLHTMCGREFMAFPSLCTGKGKGIKAAVQDWRNKTNNIYRWVCAYMSTDGDIPVARSGKTAYLPEVYRDGVTVVYEDIAGGYVYEWKNVSEEVLQTIRGLSERENSQLDDRIPIDNSGNYLTRVLTDKQLSELKFADKKTLQACISTVADAVAFLDQFSPAFYSRLETEVSLDLDYLYNTHAQSEATFGHTYTTFAAWCLNDDYEGIKYIVCFGDRGYYYRASSALALPVQGGYYIYSPCEDSELWDIRSYEPIERVTVSSLEHLEEKITINWEAPGAYQIFLAEGNQFALRFALNVEERRAVLFSGEAELVYAMAMNEAEKNQERIKQRWRELQNNWDDYGMPDSMAPTLTKEQVEALVGKDIDTVAAACKTLGDCLYYYALSGFRVLDGDLRTEDGAIEWHYNYSPTAVFEQNRGNCGGSSGLTSHLLQGDYKTVGMLGMTFSLEEGGHVINYIWDGNAYYVFDIVNWLGAFRQSGFCFSCGDTLEAAAERWMECCPFTAARLMWAFETFDGDVPVGWKPESNISYLPEQYKEMGKILLENPAEGYVYEWVTINSGVWNRIKSNRNAE